MPRREALHWLRAELSQLIAQIVQPCMQLGPLPLRSRQLGLCGQPRGVRSECRPDVGVLSLRLGLGRARREWGYKYKKIAT